MSFATTASPTCASAWHGPRGRARGLCRDPGSASAQHHDLRGQSARPSCRRPATRAYDVLTGPCLAVPPPAPRRVRLRDQPADGYKYLAAPQLGEMSIDEARGIVYIPTGSLTADFYGAIATGRTCSQLPAGPGRQDCQAPVHFPDGAPRLWTTTTSRALLVDRYPQRQKGDIGRTPADRISLRVQPRHRPPLLAVSRSVPSRRARCRSRRRGRRPPFPTNRPVRRQSFPRTTSIRGC